MKKSVKLIIIIIALAVLFVGVDIGSVFLRKKPLFAISSKWLINNGDEEQKNFVYFGVLYDTYICRKYLNPQIKPKWSKYTCPLYQIPVKKQSKNNPDDSIYLDSIQD